MVNRAIIENLIKLKCMIDTHTPQRMLVFDSHSAYDMVISLDAAIEALSTDRKGHWVGVCEYCHHLTEVTGELYLPSGFRNHNICDQCWQSALEKSKYCPNCGADMRKKDDVTV